MKYILGLLIVLGASGLFWGQNQTPKAVNITGEQVDVQQVSSEDVLDNYVVDPSDFVDGVMLVAESNESGITESEAEGLLFMREEEKLARDVYIALYEKWGVNIFKNISQSEETHMAAVLVLINKYDLTDSAAAAPGVFNDAGLQQLYDELVIHGSLSLQNAYMVGAQIEDLDIKDLAAFLSTTNNSDIKLVYEQLQKGSRNHLRAFNRQVVRSTGENYMPEYISPDDFAAIISTSVERGFSRGTKKI